MTESSNKELYIAHCKLDEAVPLFLQSDWLNLVAGKDNWEAIVVENNSEIQALFPFIQKTKFGFKVIRMPQATQFLGVYYVYPDNALKEERKLSFQNKIDKQIIDRLPKFHYLSIHFSTDYQNWLSFMWEGFRQTIRYTYVIDTTLSEENLWENIKSQTRNKIRKAQKVLTIEESQDINRFIELVKQTYSRQKMTFPFSDSLINSIFNHYNALSRCHLLIAKDKNGKFIAGLMTVSDSRKTYCLFMGSEEHTRKSAAIPLLVWESIKRAKITGLNFDFEGSVMQNIEPFFRSFGGKQIPYFNIKKTSNKFLESLLVLLNKI